MLIHLPKIVLIKILGQEIGRQLMYPMVIHMEQNHSNHRHTTDGKRKRFTWILLFTSSTITKERYFSINKAKSYDLPQNSFNQLHKMLEENLLLHIIWKMIKLPSSKSQEGTPNSEKENSSKRAKSIIRQQEFTSKLQIFVLAKLSQLIAPTSLSLMLLNTHLELWKLIQTVSHKMIFLKSLTILESNHRNFHT